MDGDRPQRLNVETRHAASSLAGNESIPTIRLMPPRSEICAHRSLPKIAGPVDIAVVNRSIQRFRNHLVTIRRQAENGIAPVQVSEHPNRCLSEVREAAECIIPGR